MIGLALSQDLVQQSSEHNEVALIEGAMGLFDGRCGVGGEGSGADLAKGLGCAVILLVNCRGMAGSVVPLVAGFRDWASTMGVQISGVIANFVGSQHHADLLQQLLQDHQLPPLLAWMDKNAPPLTSRHLGLQPPDNATIDWQPFLHIITDPIAAFTTHQPTPLAAKLPQLLAGKTVAIAKDAACCFIYQANCDCLLAMGANLAYFSPLAGEPVPHDSSAVWLPGGYPELHLPALAQSTTWQSLRRFVSAGKPLLAECGGAMLLGASITDNAGNTSPVANIAPFSTTMSNKLIALGYRQDQSGTRGHEFHYSTRHTTSHLPPPFACNRGDNGIRYKNVRASYIHWYFHSNPTTIAKWFLHN